MLKPVLSLQLPVEGKTYGRYLRTEVDDASPGSLADAVRRLVEDPNEHEIRLEPLTATGGRKKRKPAGRDEPEMPGT